MSIEPVARLLEPGRGPWDPEASDILVCRGVRDETHDVRTFLFESEQPARFHYEPGQFLTLELEIDGRTVNRCYTISSAPTRPHLISITVKRIPGGVVSPWLHQNVRAGSRIRAVGPLGDFTSFRHHASKYLFLSGGSGITPLMSMARTYHDLAEARDIVFVHAARSPADIIYRHEQAMMSHTNPHFRAVAVCEADSPGEVWGGFRGRLSLPMLQLIAPDFLEREVFTCGPAPFMAAVRAMLAQAGYDMARYHEESFDFGTLMAEEAAEAAAAPEAPGEQVFKVEFTKSRRVIECGPDTNVLDAARKAGMRLPSSCTKGLCGTCKSRKLAGEVEMKHQGGIRQREIDQGMVLICCAKPRSDLVIER
ncbi:MAG: FAD-binding oxidoreductase [Ferrovibrionaceae bacterium]